ncbi:hypothetical protein GBV73_09450 [Thermococcus sp. 101 C5]|uniref:hypothetical protein n=1 Tax=Thermococcus sp. 101 C5 TaxID=2654197 RepID=UPI00128C49D4|nr:hypothetical protein [Thermococcus sp. 101 C5]MPW39884.1 hypothetical protein [Thermococcus sp. 101 C5]
MRKTIILGVFAVLLIVSSTLLLEASSLRNTSSIPETVIPYSKNMGVLKLQHEVVLVRNGYFAVIPNVTSKEELLAFVQQNKERLNSLRDGEVVSATITFKRPLRKSELLRLLGNNVKIVAVRYKSYPKGIGQMPYPMEVNESKELEHLEEKLRVELKEKSGIKEFRLIEGFISAKVIAPKEELVRILKSKDVFDVNVGPRDVAEKHEIKQVIIEDFWWYYEKYILKAKNK